MEDRRDPRGSDWGGGGLAVMVVSLDSTGTTLGAGLSTTTFVGLGGVVSYVSLRSLISSLLVEAGSFSLLEFMDVLVPRLVAVHCAKGGGGELVSLLPDGGNFFCPLLTGTRTGPDLNPVLVLPVLILLLG